MTDAFSPRDHVGSGTLAMASSGRPARAAAGYAAVIVGSGILFQFWQAEPVPAEVYLLGMATLALCLLPLALWQAGAGRGAPMFELFCAAHAIAFMLPVFLHENAVRAFNAYVQLDWVVMQRAQRLSLLGIAAMLGGYYLFPHSPLAVWLPRADLPMEPRRFPQFLLVAFGVGGGVQVLDRLTGNHLVFGGSAALFSMLAFVMGLGIALLAFRVFGPRGQPHRLSRLLLYGVTGVSAVIGTTTGMLEAGFIPLLVLLAARWTATRRVPVTWLVLGGVALVVMNAAKHDYRSEVWQANQAPSVPEQLAIWKDKVSTVAATLTTPEGLNDAVVRAVHRFDLIHIFAHVLEMTPGEVSFYEGSSYSYLLYGWIPRAIWPDKPIAVEASITFALDYGLLLESQRDTVRIGIGFLAEAYANFGVLGILGLMFLIGNLLSAAATIFNGPQSDGGKAAFIVILAIFMNGLGSATMLIFYFAIQGFIVLPLLLRFFAKSWRAPVAPVPSVAIPVGGQSAAPV